MAVLEQKVLRFQRGVVGQNASTALRRIWPSVYAPSLIINFQAMHVLLRSCSLTVVENIHNRKDSTKLKIFKIHFHEAMIAMSGKINLPLNLQRYFNHWTNISSL